MHRPTVAVLGLVALGATAAYAVPRIADAQQANPPVPAQTAPAAPGMPGPGMNGAPMPGHPWMRHGERGAWMQHGEHGAWMHHGDRAGWMRHGDHGRRGPWMMMAHRFQERMRNWGLFYHVQNKHLTAADVTTIAKAILAMHGNHTWQVMDVTAPASGTGGFVFGAKDGTVIARFSINLKNGHIQRVG